MTPAEMVREFHERFGLPVRTQPGLPDMGEASHRLRLLEEEVGEYEAALLNDDLLEIADALADMVYIIYGTALTYGIDLDAVLAEVHRSNMTKLGPDGKPIYRSDGKVQKGPNYSPPDIASVIGVTA